MSRPWRWGPHANPATAVCVGRGGATERYGIFAAGGNGVSGVCADEGGGSDVVKLDNALAAVDDFVSQRLGL